MRTWFKWLLSDQKGFSLTEITVGMGIMAGVSLAGMKLFEQQKKAQKLVSSENSLNAYHLNLVNVFTNTQMCNATMRSHMVPASGYIQQGPVSNFFKCTNPSDCADYKLDSGDAISAYFPTSTSDRWVDDKKLWRISSLGVLNQVTSSGDLRLQVTYESNPDFLAVQKRVKKDIVVPVRFESGVAGSRFRECVNNQKASVNNLQSDMCKALNKNRHSVSGAGGNNLAYWDEAQQKCIVNSNTTVTCTAPLIFDGYDKEGNIICKSPQLMDTTDTSKNSNPVNSNCSSTSMTVDPSTGQLVLNCIP